MLTQVEKKIAISEEFSDLTSQIKALSETGALAEKRISSPDRQKFANPTESVQVDFSLTTSEQQMISEALIADKAIYQISVIMAPDALMKAVRAIMIIQRLEAYGTVVKMLPSIEELESNDQQKVSLLLITSESPDEVKADILEISEILDAEVTTYSYAEQRACTPVQSQAKESLNIQTDALPDHKDKLQAADDIQIQSSAQNHVHTIRVDTARMDNLINLVGEMVITRTRLVKIGDDLKALNQNVPLVNSLNDTNVYLGRLMSDLQESVMRLRMVPIGTVFSRYPRLVRDFCRKSGKKIELVIKGEETELDKTVIEMIGDPLTHIIRNSVDHGIELPEQRIAAGKPEMGLITLDAYHEGNHIAIIVSDDGAGLDMEKIVIKATQRPGF